MSLIKSLDNKPMDIRFSYLFSATIKRNEIELGGICAYCSGRADFYIATIRGGGKWIRCAKHIEEVLKTNQFKRNKADYICYKIVD